MKNTGTYINGIGLISPQKTAGTNEFLPEIVEHCTDFLKCIEPNYKEYIDPIAARRMSRLIKMGITAARLAIYDASSQSVIAREPLVTEATAASSQQPAASSQQPAASSQQPAASSQTVDAIITGTGLGSVEDTEKILGSIHLDQPFLNPTPFMQSTYNTISSQIAINLKCHGYNSTYVHRTFSFESGLQDALLQLEEGSSITVLAGGIDEMTMNHLDIVRRLGEWKREPFRNLDLFSHPTPGALAGEGAGFFLLSSEKNNRTYAQLRSAATYYRPGGVNEFAGRIREFLEECGLTVSDVDVLLAGYSGDRDQDRLYDNLAAQLFPGTATAAYKHLCGEYHTATAFALWAAANMIRRQSYPEIFRFNEFIPSSIKNILICNHYRGVNHSVMLVSL